MKKIIAAFDGLRFSESTMLYAIDIAKMSGSHIVGVFLDDITYTSYKIYDLVAEEGTSQALLNSYDLKDKIAREKAAIAFNSACNKAGVSHAIHHDRNIALHELIHESVYADLLIIDKKETLTYYVENLPTRFVKDLLADVQCPVLLVPEIYHPVTTVVFLYDGEPSSVYAIKMYDYVLNKSTSTVAVVVSVRGKDDAVSVPDKYLLKEFLQRHFQDIEYKLFQGDSATEINSFLKKQSEDTLVVAGSYHRSSVSRWLRPSIADSLMKELKLPLFIAHSK
ncbi:MAG: universal stress protein [Chitinophagaceae bacterium]